MRVDRPTCVAASGLVAALGLAHARPRSAAWWANGDGSLRDYLGAGRYSRKLPIPPDQVRGL